MSTETTEREAEVERVRPRRQSRAGKVVHFTADERAARGRAARAELPRRVHGEWEPSPHRSDPVDLLEEQAKTRVPELVPIRYGRMLVSPFAFYRGGAALMAADLAEGPRSGLQVQLCGDAHLSNFGVYAGPDRRLIFSVNDFDETLPGPFEWDVKRLVASFAVAGRHRGFSGKERAGINAAVVRSYRESMHSFASMRNMDLWYVRADVEELAREFAAGATGRQRRRMEKNVAHARAKTGLKALDKLTRLVDGERRIVSDPPLVVPIRELAEPGQQAKASEGFRYLIRAYRRTLAADRRRLLERFRYVDAARKVVGVGSVGTRAWIVLMLGRDNDDPLFLQAKEAQRSVLEPHLGKSEFTSHGQRVVEGQRLVQSASDIMLGWLTAEGIDGLKRDFYVRQLWDSKGAARVDELEPNAYEAYGRLCGWTLAKAHARSGDAIAIASYLGASRAFDKALVAFAEAYADQNERDYDALKQAVDTGRVTAETDL
jgi:uncharacterized protein (DUF2252 family)